MALIDDVLTILLDYSAGYKLMRRSLLQNSAQTSKQQHHTTSDQALYLTLARLKKHGLVIKKENSWEITAKGKEYFKKRLGYSLPPHQKSNTHKQLKKNMIIAFDIPEKYRRKRDWLRMELTCLGFSPIQKSVWLGPAPLPENFIKNLHDLQLLNYLKFFEVKEENII